MPKLARHSPPRIGALQGVNFAPPGMAHVPAGPTGRWKGRANRLVNSMSNNPRVEKDFRPFLRDAEHWLEGAMVQLASASGGQCGPIESQALATSAWQLAYSRYWMWRLAEDPMNSKLAETASRLSDAARQNALAAYDLAVRLFRHKPAEMADPLAAFEAQVLDATPGAFSGGLGGEQKDPSPEKKKNSDRASGDCEADPADAALENE